MLREASLRTSATNTFSVSCSSLAAFSGFCWGWSRQSFSDVFCEHRDRRYDQTPINRRSCALPRPTLLLRVLIFAFILLGLGSVFWALLVQDSYIADMWSSSMCLLSPGASEIAGWLAIACAIVGSLVAGFHALSRRTRRVVALSAVILNLSAPFIAYWSSAYFSHVAKTAREEHASSRR